MNNCVNFSKSRCFNINQPTSLDYDRCFIKTQNNQNKNISNYNISNFNSCVCQIKDVQNISLNQKAYVGLQWKDGFGWIGSNGCIVDKDSNLRNSRNSTNLNCIHQLNSRMTLTTPLIKKGKFFPDRESRLLHRIDTGLKKSCEKTSGKDVSEYRFYPLINRLKKNVQNPDNIIEENNDWTRSGIPSRQLIRDKKYLNMCGFVKNKKYWEKQ